jgi:hypothetical protein
MSKFDLFKDFVNTILSKGYNIYAIAIQEIWDIPQPSLVEIPGFKFIYKCRISTRGGGVGFYIKNNISHKILNNLSYFEENSFECLTVEIRVKSRKYVLSTIYRPPSSRYSTTADYNDQFITNIDTHLSNLASYNKNSLVFLDSNVNLLALNSNTCVARYFETLYSNGFSNLIGKATRIKNASFSLIDQILAKVDFKCNSGTLITDFSDHFTNFCYIDTNDSSSRPGFRFVRSFTKSAVDRFKGALQNLNWYDVTECDEVNNAFNLFWEKFYSLYLLHFPLKKVKFNRNIHKINNFMTSGILTSRSTKNLLHKKALLNPGLHYEKYKTYRNIYNRVVKLSKQITLNEQFKKYQRNPKKTWDLLKETALGTKPNNEITEIFDEDRYLNKPEEMANSFNRFFSTIGTTIRDNIPQFSKNPTDFIPEYDPNKPKLSFERVGPIWLSDVVKSMPNKSSTDLDGLSIKILKQIIDRISVPLVHIFNLSFDTGVFPEKLKESRIVPIFKTGDPKSCDNYRPISLVNTISKLLEKIVSIKLTNHLQLNKLLHKHQYGFQRGYSTEHNLLQVVNFVANSLNSGKYCIGVFIDLKKAFDVCSHNILLEKLARLGVQNNELRWFESYLCDRKQKVDVQGCLSDELTLNISVLQGTTLGPILFLCYINDIFNASNLATFLFADDTTLLAENDNLQDLISYINTEMKKIANWLIVNKLALNLSKTKYIIFRTRGKKIPNDIDPVVVNQNELHKEEDPDLITTIERIYNDSPITENRSFKLLGVYFDEFLSFDKNTDVLCAKLSRANFFLRRISHTISLKSLRCLYFALFHSHLIYCLNISSCTSQSNLNRINILHKKAIRIINRAKYNAHTAPLFKQSSILPFDMQVKYNKLMLMHSIRYNYCPSSLNDIFTVNANNNDHNLRHVEDFIVPHPRIELFKKLPHYTLTETWNKSGDLIYYNNKITFMYALKYELTQENQDVT